MAGREVLVKSSVTPISLYVMQTAKVPVGIYDRIDSLSCEFLWGSTLEKKRIHLVNWDNICRSKVKGGLGFRSMRDWNEILLAKLGWRFLTEENKLWARVLKEKYLSTNRSLFDAKSNGEISSLWRSLLSGRKVLSRGLSTRIGDGCDTRFWTDVWCKGGALYSQATTTIPNSLLQLSVRDFWADYGWKTELFGHLLPSSAVDCIQSHLCSPLGEMKDLVTWQFNSNGLFSVKTAYESLVPATIQPVPIIKAIWRLPILPRTKMFGWLAWNKRLLTNQQRFARTFTDNEDCQVCSWMIENQIHALRDCSNASIVWNHFVGPKLHDSFHSLPFDDWFHNNIVERGNEIVMRVSWPSLFMIICWKIWGWRCDLVMGQKQQGIDEKVYCIWSLIGELLNYNDQVHRPIHNEILLHWDKPIEGWHKLNCDGSWVRELNKAGAGGVIRDDVGNWVCGFSMKCGNCAIDRAELWGILWGLRIPWDGGLRKVELESDSATSIAMIASEENQRHPLFDLITTI